ncbi:MAG: glycine cleavage system aminomethyltransferase GcvT [Ardenticatenia bacterium]|nr:glycine cleavage system aminomethyltransferase GcvT [Ardenticatenia bacterium]
MSEGALRKTPLYEVHRQMGARMIPFGGWTMPVQYTSILEEHRAVRTAAGLFDVSHMGEFEFTGPGARPLLQHLTANNVEKLRPGQAQYSMFLNKRGGTIDDLIVYCLEEDRYLVVVNAANIEKDWAHVSHVAAHFGGARAHNRSDAYALLALQGPRSQAILAPLTEADLTALPFYHVMPAHVAGISVLVARTGYTGEEGFELFVAPANAPALWQTLIDAGRQAGLRPAGLGARDTLRLEASLPLYGHELDEDTSPIEAGLGRFVAHEGDYIGADAIRRQREEGVSKRLVMLEVRGRGVPRHGYPVHTPEGQEVGRVTSGSYAPWLKKNIAMAYVPPEWAAPGQTLTVLIRGRAAEAIIVRRPFYRRPRGTTPRATTTAR